TLGDRSPDCNPATGARAGRARGAWARRPGFAGPGSGWVYNRPPLVLAKGGRPTRTRPRRGEHGTSNLVVGGAAVKTTKQISAFVENKPGRMANVLSALAREKVNLAALTIMDSHEHSVLRLVADDPTQARQTLRGLNIPTSEVDVVVVEL